jgi:hypothetical protein
MAFAERHAWIRTPLSLALTGCVYVLMTGSAQALPSVTPTTPWAQPNGRVLAIARVNGVVYIGGKFTSVTDSDGVTVLARSHVAAISAADGHVLPWNPGANGPVRSIAVSTDGANLYFGGDFTTFGSRTRTRLAGERSTTTASTSTGVLLPWSPRADRSVYALLPLDGRIYVGGSFRHLNAHLRLRLGAVNAATGRVARWAPKANGIVRMLLASPAGGRIFAAGDFSRVNGGPTGHLTALDPLTGRRTPWKSRAANNVLALGENATTLFAGDTGGGGHLRAYDLTTGKLRWTNTSDGNVTSLGMFGSGASQRVLVGGHFNKFGKYVRHKVAAINPATGLVDPAWSPYASGSILGVFSILAYGQHAYFGGDFTSWQHTGMGAIAQAHVADFPTTASADTTPPSVTAPSTRLLTGGTVTGGRAPVVVRWSASDAGSGICRSTLQRDFNGGSFAEVPLMFATASSATTWMSPSTHPYTLRVRATDCSDNSSAYRASGLVRVAAFQDSSASIRYRGHWTRLRLPKAYGGSVRSTGQTGASAGLRFTGRSVAWVASMGPSDGAARVTIDGAPAAIVRLHSSAVSRRRIVYSRGWPTDGVHTIRITVIGTVGHPSADVDAFLTIR